jgi:hypothetical protein
MSDQNDSTPTGLYVAAFFSDETNQNLTKYLKDNNIPNPIVSPGFHTTIVYSRVPVNTFEPNHSVDIKINPDASLEAWDMQNGMKCLVLCYRSLYLDLRFQEAMAQGATYDFDEYKPHISLSYDLPPDFDVSALPLPEFPIHIIGEYAEPIELEDAEQEEDIFENLFTK